MVHFRLVMVQLGLVGQGMSIKDCILYFLLNSRLLLVYTANFFPLELSAMAGYT